MIRRLAILEAALVLTMLSGACSSTSPGETVLVSRDSSGQAGNGSSWEPAISADGRHVTYMSWAINLVPEDTREPYSGCPDVFVHDLGTRETTRVSVDSAGNQANGCSWEPTISANGRYVAFQSEASNLVPGDSNEASDVFVHDLWTEETARVSTNSAGEQGDNGSYEPSISEDGRYVAFASYATNLVPLDSNGTIDVFVHDRETRETSRVSISSAGGQGDSWSVEPSVSANGRYVAFASRSTNLVTGDTNDYCDDGDTIYDDNCSDIFVHDRATGDTTRVSLDSYDREGNGRSLFPAISSDGRHVAFLSEAANFMAGGGNVAWGTFVRDQRMRKTTQIAQEPWRSGMETFGDVFIMSRCRPALSTDGRYVTFAFAIDGQIVYSNTSGDQLEKASINQAGEQVLGVSESPSISGDGRHIAFASWSMNLAPGDDGKYAQVYVRKLPVTSESVSAMGITAAAIAGAAAVTTLAAAATLYVRRRRQERLM